MTTRDPIGFDTPPFNLPKIESFSDNGPRGCDDLTTAVLCVLAGAVTFVMVLAACGVLP